MHYKSKLGIFGFLVLHAVAACHDDIPNCGCSSNAKSTITESNSNFPSPGILVFKRQIGPLDNFYNDSYWLTSPGYSRGLIVCNPELLGNLQEVKNYPSGEGDIVKFEGQVKTICGESPGPWTYDLITLTQIQKYEFDPTSCGCSSPVSKEIPELTPLIGVVKYKRQKDPLDTYYNNKYWITYVEQNCVNCVHAMIVCNEDIMIGFEDLINSDMSVSIRFSGQIKKACMHPFAWLADYTYDDITITKIERL